MGVRRLGKSRAFQAKQSLFAAGLSAEEFSASLDSHKAVVQPSHIPS